LILLVRACLIIVLIPNCFINNYRWFLSAIHYKRDLYGKRKFLIWIAIDIEPYFCIDITIKKPAISLTPLA